MADSIVDLAVVIDPTVRRTRSRDAVCAGLDQLGLTLSITGTFLFYCLYLKGLLEGRNVSRIFLALPAEYHMKT